MLLQESDLVVLDIPAMPDFLVDRFTKVYVDLLMRYWYDLCKYDLHLDAFYSLNIGDFTDFATKPDKIFFLICKKQQKRLSPVSHVYLNNFNGMSAQLHFGIVKRCHRPQKSKAIAEKIFTHIAGCKIEEDVCTTVDGIESGTWTRPLVETLIGMTPISNKPAVRFVKRLGFKQVTVIKNAAELIHKRKFDDVMVTTLNIQEGVSKNGKFKVRRRRGRP